VPDQRVQRLGHVGVAQIPRGGAAPEHRPVVPLGVERQARVLFGVEILVLGDAAVPRRVVGGAAAKLEQLLDNVVFARLGDAGDRRVAVRLRVLSRNVRSSRSG
jgi:hypothetical protein